VDILKPNQAGLELKKEGGTKSPSLDSPFSTIPPKPSKPFIPKPSIPKPEFPKAPSPVSPAAPDSIQGPSISAKGPIIPLRKPKISLENVEIRTMEKDIKRLGGKGMAEALKEIPKFKIPQVEISKKAEPPKGLPVIEPIKKPVPSFEAKPEIPLPPRPSFPSRLEALPKADLSPLLRLKKAQEEKESKEITGAGRKINPKTILVVSGIVVILAAAGGGFFYWWKFIKKPATHFSCQEFQCVEVEGKGENKCQINNDCLPPEPQEPLSLISVDKTETIEYSTDPGAVMQSSVLEKIKTKLQTEQTKGAFIRILVKTTDENLVKEYVSLSQISQSTGIVIPSAVAANFDNEYTLFAYMPDSEEAGLCQQAQINDSQCAGPRLGLAIGITSKDAAKQAMANWQTTMIDDLKPLILSQITKANGFKSDANLLYQGKDIYYQNLPISPIALNYALSDDLLIIATSKNCLYQALDRLGAK
jgi:hypothetical protein